MGILYREIVKARLSGNMERLNEVSLGRVWAHAQRAEDKSLGIVTAWRAARKKSDNEKSMGSLMSKIRSMGLGAFKLTGHWQECQQQGVAYKDCPKDQLVASTEPSLGVVGISKEAVQKLGKEFDQDAVIYLGPETKGDAVLLFKDGSDMNIGKFSPSKIAQAYSRVRGGPFVFEGWDLQPASFVDAITEQAMRAVRGALALLL